MPVVCLKYKRKPWVVKYREPWSGRPRQRAFAVEAEARAFEDAQASLYERERAIIKAVRRRRAQGRPASLTIAEVLDRYLDSLGNPSTRAASAYHLRLFADIYGQRKAHCLTLEDVGAFLALQQQRGVSKSTACRRMGIVRAAYHWAARWGLLPTNPLAGLQLASPAPQTPDPPTAREARMLYATAAPHVQRVIALGMAPARVSAPVSFFGSAGRISTRVEPRCACPMPPREHGPRPARCRYGRMFCACCGAGKRKTRPWAVHGSSTTEDAPCAVSAELGIIPCAGRALSGASGPMICATLSPAGLWIMMRTLNAWPRLWATPTKR